jgi:DNA-binding CsgD family transcriptional regulator
MDHLGADDYRLILKAIEILESAEDYASFPERTLKAVTAALEVDFASFSEVDLLTGRNRFLVKPDATGMEPGSTGLVRLVRRFGNHPILAHQVARQTSRSVDVERFLQRVRLLGMVGNCCGEAQLLLNLEISKPADHHLIGIAINRGVRDFDKRDIEIFEALRPHIAAAYRVAFRLGRIEASEAEGSTVSGLPLTSRESEVLYWVSMGKTNGEVGDILGARPMTVKKHLEHIYDKLGVPNRTAAARVIASQGSP